jgi:hypothetical protein
VQARTKFLSAAAVLGAGAAWWRRHTRADRWHTDHPLPSLELPIAGAEPVVVPDPVADPADLAEAANRPHLTLLGDLPLDDPHPSVPGGDVADDESATVTSIADRSGQPH